jgi:(R)-2-hydroxyacyl-CoA dehydratese activating ATPase
MIVAGCDVGSLTAKALILKDGSLLAASIIPDKSRPEESAAAVIAEALSLANLSMDDIEYIMGTGYGRKHIPFVNDVKSEISCHAKGAWFLLPSVSTVIDIGGQDCKVTRLEKDGKVAKFITNDKCAAGTGRFLEVMAQALGVPLEEMGALSKKAKKSQVLASICTVWAQAEVIRMINDGLPIPDIGASVNEAMASRVALIANTLGIEKDVCMTGGVSKNVGVVKSLEQKLGVKIKKPGVDPQLVGALGAALFAQEKMKKGK